MKHEFTFAEVAKIFNQVVKVETAAMQYQDSDAKYQELDKAFDAEFKVYGYTFFGAPESLHTLFDDKCNAMNARDKAMNKAYKAIKEFGELIGIGDGYVDIVEERVQSFIKGKYYWEAVPMIERVKCLAMEAARKVR